MEKIGKQWNKRIGDKETGEGQQKANYCKI